MNARRTDSPMTRTWSFSAWSTPRLRVCAVTMALLLPGSFVILPFLWLWNRLYGRRTP
jgi:hypothetical protein